MQIHFEPQRVKVSTARHAVLQQIAARLHPASPHPGLLIVPIVSPSNSARSQSPPAPAPVIPSRNA